MKTILITCTGCGKHFEAYAHKKNKSIMRMINSCDLHKKLENDEKKSTEIGQIDKKTK